MTRPYRNDVISLVRRLDLIESLVVLPVIQWQWFGSEIDPATNPPGAVTLEASGAAAPTNGQVLRRRIRTFNKDTDQGLFLVFALPYFYVSGGTLDFRFTSNATTGDVMWKTAYALSLSGTTDFDALAFGTVNTVSSTVPPTAGVDGMVTIDLGVTGGFWPMMLHVYLGRDADHASDTCGSDAELCEPWSLSVVREGQL